MTLLPAFLTRRHGDALWDGVVRVTGVVALAAIPLAAEPIQKIRFIPYAHARFDKFKKAWAGLFG